MKPLDPPVDVRIGGKLRHVVATDPAFWVELRDGQVVVHAGRLLLDGPPPTRFLDEPRPCAKCSQPAITLPPRARSRPVHDWCLPIAALSDEMVLQVEFGVAADLGASIIERRG